MPSAASADTGSVKAFVAFVICAAVVAPASAAAGTRPSALSQAERLSGLKAHRPIRTVIESSPRFGADVLRVVDRDYPRTLQRTDDRLYVALGLLPAGRSTRAKVVAAASALNAQYDPVGRVLRLRRKPAPTRAEVVHELVRALVDQNVGLRRLSTLRPRDRDAALAATAVVEGLAALASGRRAAALRGSPLDRFLALERTAGLGSGRTFVAQLRSVGGAFAVSSALRTFPGTTEQVLHLDVVALGVVHGLLDPRRRGRPAEHGVEAAGVDDGLDPDLLVDAGHRRALHRHCRSPFARSPRRPLRR